MKRIHVLTVALLLGVAAVFGVVAATRTGHVGAAAHTRVSSGTIKARSRRLARVERQLRRALRDRPPALPPVPAVRSPAPPAAQLATSPPAPRIVYHRPAPVVVVTHSRGHGERESESGDD
jgi:hypothetical protein